MTEKDEKKRGKVREQVVKVLRDRKKKLSEYEYTLALQYLKHRERWRVSLMFQAAEKERRERLAQKGNRRGITGMGGGPSSSSRNRSDSRNQQGGAGAAVSVSYGAPGFAFGRSDGVANLDEEMEMIKTLQRKEGKTLCKVPDMILDKHERATLPFLTLVTDWSRSKAEHSAENLFPDRGPGRGITKSLPRREELSTHRGNPGRNTADCVVYY